MKSREASHAQNRKGPYEGAPKAWPIVAPPSGPWYNNRHTYPIVAA